MAMFDKYTAQPDPFGSWGVWNTVSNVYEKTKLTEEEARARAQELNDERNDSGISFYQKGYH